MSFKRNADRRTSRADGVLYSVHDRVPLPTVLALAAQHIAVQAIYLVLPVVAATAFHLDARGTANFVSLAILSFVALQLLQTLTRGPVGAGYQMPSIPTPVMMGAYLLAASAGLGPGQAGMLLLIAGIVAIGVTFLIPRPQSLMPTEVAGVVIFLLGATLLPVLLDVLRVLDRHFEQEGAWDILLAFLSFFIMVFFALCGGKLAPHGMLIGALVGILVAVPLGYGVGGAATTLAVNPWFAWPHPIAPSFDGLSVGLLLAFVFATLPAKATILGNLIAFQRAADGAWDGPDGPPLRRGLLAHGVAISVAGAAGAMAPGPSSACMGLSIVNRTLSLRIVLVGSAVFVLLALSPKAVSLFVLVPPSVKAAMLLYVASLMIATGCQLITSRMLDVRRSLVVGLGLMMGLAVLIAPAPFRQYLPALASALTLGALTAFLLNLVTLPLVSREVRFVLPLDARLHVVAEDQASTLGGAWGARRETMQCVADFLIEAGELLADRGLQEVPVVARRLEGTVTVMLGHSGIRLPKPAARPEAADLEGSEQERAAFALWLATRRAMRVQQSDGELRATFRD